MLQARRDALNLALERLTLEREAAGLWAQLEYLIPGSAPQVAAAVAQTPASAD